MAPPVERPSTPPPPPPSPADRRPGPPPPSEPPLGPPPPPRDAVRGDGPARLTAATLVSATGALLLLAAAATFLAVSWDTLGLTARVAAVGAGTVGAIVGGAHLRRTLPAVGAVVFHLGALLLPVDALGLALQLDVAPAGTWIAVGLTAVIALPVAAAVGRSRVLAATALAGVVVSATGLGLAGVTSAPFATAIAAVLALAVIGRGGDAHDDPRVVLGLAAPALSVAAVAGPLLVATASGLAVAGGGAPLRAAASAGWIPTTWSQPIVAGAVAVAAMVATAVRRSSARWIGAVPVLIALVAVTTLLPGDAPRLARLLPWPLLFLAAEAGAVAMARDRALGKAFARVALVAEVVAAFAVPGALWVLATAARPVSDLFAAGAPTATVLADPALAAVAAVTTLAWALAATRRGAADAAAITATAAALATGAAAATLLLPRSGVGVLIALAAVAATVSVRGGGLRSVAASTATVVLGGTALSGLWSVLASDPLPRATGQVLLAAAAALLAAALIGRIVRHAEAGDGPYAVVVLLPPAAAATLVVGLTLDAAAGPGIAILAVTGSLLAGGAALDRAGVDGTLLRAAAVATVLLADPTAAGGLEAAAVVAPAALLTVLVLGTASVRRPRPWLPIAAGAVLVRAVAGVAFAATGSRPATGGVLLGLTVVAAFLAALRPRWRAAGTGTAALAVVPAIWLLSVTPTALAWGTVAVGAAVVAAGLVTRQITVAHVGGLVTTLGVWQLLAIAEVAALDVWLLAPAAHLWLAALPARRAGRVSSWVADVPPLAAIVVPALLERIAGGSGWHAALAGTLAVVAVVGGGAGRHGGPLVVGVVTVVAVVGIETLAVVAAVPTWAWLTAGGTVLLAAGALIERTGSNPVASVRRLADVVAERFD